MSEARALTRLSLTRRGKEPLENVNTGRNDISMLIEGGAKTNIFQQMSWILDSFGLSRTRALPFKLNKQKGCAAEKRDFLAKPDHHLHLK